MFVIIEAPVALPIVDPSPITAQVTDQQLLQ